MLGPSDIISLFSNFGPWAVLAGIMVWNNAQDRKAARQRDLDEIERQKADRDLARERIGTDKSLASSMTELAAEIRGMKR